MLGISAALLMACSAPDSNPEPPHNGIAVYFGMGIVGLAEHRLSDDIDGLGGIPIEVAMVQHDDRIWVALGMSWMYGFGAIASETRDLNAHLFGLHGDLAYSVLAFDYADVKLGIGAALRYASVDRGNWSTGTWESPGTPLPGGHQNKLLATARTSASLLLHSPGGSGGLELIPLRIEYGPSMFQIAPTLSFSKFF